MERVLKMRTEQKGEKNYAWDFRKTVALKLKNIKCAKTVWKEKVGWELGTLWEKIMRRPKATTPQLRKRASLAKSTFSFGVKRRRQLGTKSQYKMTENRKSIEITVNKVRKDEIFIRKAKDEKKPLRAWLRTKSFNRAEPRQHCSCTARKVFNNDAEKAKLFNTYFCCIYEKGREEN